MLFFYNIEKHWDLYFMVRLIPFLAAFLLVAYKIFKLNQKVLAAKSFIFINKINEGLDLHEANYLANLFDFFKKSEAKQLFNEMAKVVKEKYDDKKDSLIYRAETWGFVNTHTRAMFKKRKASLKGLEKLFLGLNPKTFSGNAKETSKDIINAYWDINALKLNSLDSRVCILKLLLEKYKDTPEKVYKEVATKIASEIAPDAKYLDKEDVDVIKEWNNLIKK